MSTPNLKALQDAIAAVRADLASDTKEDMGTPSERQDMADDKRLLAALDAVDRAISSRSGGPLPGADRMAMAMMRGGGK